MEKQNNILKNIDKFEELMERVAVERKGIHELMEYIRTSGFYQNSASSRFHGCYEGGLLEHSLNVYYLLSAKKKWSPIWSVVLADIPETSLILVSLCHDLCKIGAYRKKWFNRKVYDETIVSNANPWEVKKDQQGSYVWQSVEGYELNDDAAQLGHGEQSAFILLRYLGKELRDYELYSVRWHMLFSNTSSPQEISQVGKSMELHPLTLCLAEADMEATALCESEKNKCFLEKLRFVFGETDDGKPSPIDDECPFF